ncbi:MAG: glycosyltransferase [Eubacteriales bacterium]|nr:glycosyltransferase [Eubacteriales bacterium]
MEKLLTVVVPTYNIEKYIEMCLDSFAIREAEDRLEVLVVNDGSSDSSPELARAYEREYPAIFRVIDKENGGHGSAINTGLREAAGKYFKVVDGDDWVDKRAFLYLLKVLEESDSDIVASNYCWVHHLTMEKKPERLPFQGVEYEREYDFSEIADKTFIKMHSMTFKTQVLRDAGLWIDEHCYYVDLEYVILPISHVRTVTFIPDIVYMYRIGMQGQSMSLENMQKNRKQYHRVFQRLLQFYRECTGNGCPEANQQYIERALGLAYASYFKILLSFPFCTKVWKYMARYDKRLKREYPKIYESVENKAVRLLRASGYVLYPAAQAALGVQRRMKKKKGLNL